jgi:DUF438 domain-containing protein
MSELIDNRQRRIQTLKQVIRGLQEGEPLEGVRGRLVALVGGCDASDVASAEQELISEGMPPAKLMETCDLHSQAVRGVLADQATMAVEPGHPVDTFRRENAALREQMSRFRAALDAVAAEPEGSALEEARRAHALLMDVDKHYLRKEHLLFPFLEKRGITGPSTVMWGKHDEVRALLRELGEALAAGSAPPEGRPARTAAEAALAALEEMVFKEERILLPLALQHLEEAEWAQIAAQSPQFGYCLADPAAEWRPREHAAAAAVASSDAPRGAPAMVFPSGSLSLEQLAAIFATLPVDVTFVDASDRVRFFSEGRNRVFHRAKAVIGRQVQHCHPPASVDTVDRILADFRSGAQSAAEFWIDMRGRFVHVRYFALRDDAGTYLGTLEVTQDLTRERALQGERRLLQYES